MANFETRDGANTQKFLKGEGDGTNENPFILFNNITPDLLVDRSLGTAVSKIVKATAGRLFSFSCTNLNTASTRYLQFFDSASVPAGGATPLSTHPVYASGGLLVLDITHFGFKGSAFVNGITWGFSTTPLVYTAGVATDAIVTVRFV